MQRGGTGFAPSAPACAKSNFSFLDVPHVCGPIIHLLFEFRDALSELLHGPFSVKHALNEGQQREHADRVANLFRFC